MTRFPDAGQEAAHYRRVASRRGKALAVLARDLIRERLRPRLLRLEDFETFIGLDAVTRPDETVDLLEVDRRIDDLLRRRPELRASLDNVPRRV